MFHHAALSTFHNIIAPRDARGNVVGDVSPADCEAVLANAHILEQRIPLSVAFPADAQLALLWWAWVNGATNKKYPRMFAALKPAGGKIQPDFDKAAEEAFSHGENMTIKVAVTQMFQNATDVVLLNHDVSKLVWPAIVPSPPKRTALRKPFSGLKLGTALALASAGGWCLWRNRKRAELSATPAPAPEPNITTAKIEERSPSMEAPMAKMIEKAERRTTPKPLLNLSKSLSRSDRYERKLVIDRKRPKAYEEESAPALPAYDEEEELYDEEESEESDE